MVEGDDQFPNCSVQHLPVLVYKAAFASSASSSDLAKEIEQTFDRNGFPPKWRAPLFDYPHYHSTSHEILGVYKGSACARFGGPKQAVEHDVGAGDIMVIPAGVSHESVISCGGFDMVGAYPIGYKWDMKYGKSQEEKEEAEANIRKVGVPTTDPVYGSKGPIFDHWQTK